MGVTLTVPRTSPEDAVTTSDFQQLHTAARFSLVGAAAGA